MAEENEETTVEETTTEEKSTEVIKDGGEQEERAEKTETTERSEKVKPDDDWKAKARKHEAAAKRERKEREALEARLKEREDADKSEQDKAIEAAREEGRTAALTEAQKERRQDRLENAATKLAVKGVAVGEGDDAKTLKFADPDDALVYVEQAIRAGEVDEDDIYDDQNKVKAEGLTDALRDILVRKPHLVAKAEGNGGRPQGSSDAGRGQGGGKSLEEMTADDHLKAIQNR